MSFQQAKSQWMPKALPIIRTDYARAMHSHIRTTEGLKASTWQTKDNMAGHVDLQPANIGLFTACQLAQDQCMWKQREDSQDPSQGMLMMSSMPMVHIDARYDFIWLPS